MKKIDLNIKIDDLKPKAEFKDKKGWEISKEYIILAFSIYQTQPNKYGQPTGATVLEHRKIYKIMDSLENIKEGVLALEDDWFKYLKEVFNKVSWSGGTKIVVRIADKLDEVK